LAEHKFPKEVIGTLAFNFSEQAGYYLARTRDSELEMIMTIARSSDRTDWV